MRFPVKISALIVLFIALSACASKNIPLPSGAQAYSLMDQAAAPYQTRAYRIGDGDTLRINVFQEPDFTLQEAVVDVNGNVTIPLVGDIPAMGLTTGELVTDLRSRLARYLIDPQVTVAILESTAERVFVEGQVQKSGAFPLQGDVTLLGALALAEGTTDISDDRQVLIFRTVDGTRYGAKFDVEQIRAGTQPDPRILPQDLIVVGRASTKQWVRDLIQLSPLFSSVFVAFIQK